MGFVNDRPGRGHVIDVDSLMNLLERLPTGWTLQPNDVQNLAVFDREEKFVGYVDLGFEKVELFDEPIEGAQHLL